MKKLFFRTGIFLISLSLIIIGCTEDNNETTEQSTQIKYRSSDDDVKVAKQLFIDMMSTNEYIDYVAKRDSFVSMMNGNSVIFDTKQKYMDWISINLSKTNFTSIIEFSDTQDEMVARYAAVMDNNQVLFSILSKVDKEQLIEIIRPSLGTVPIVTSFNACQNGCMSDCEFSLNGLEFSRSMNFGMGFSNNAFILASVEAMYYSQYASIAIEFNTCYSAC